MPKYLYIDGKKKYECEVDGFYKDYTVVALKRSIRAGHDCTISLMLVHPNNLYEHVWQPDDGTKIHPFDEEV